LSNAQTYQSETPAAAVMLLVAFCAIVGAWYLIKNRRKVGRKLRRAFRSRRFWGKVAAFAFVAAFTAVFVFLAFRD